MAEQAAYRIRVQGWIDRRWSNWFGEVTIATGSTEDGTLVTTLTGVVPDQAALRGILSQVWDLNLTILSVTRIDAGLAKQKGGSRGYDDSDV